MKSYEEEARIAYAVLLDIEGKTEEAISTLESINNMSSIWHLAQVSIKNIYLDLLFTPQEALGYYGFCLVLGFFVGFFFVFFKDTFVSKSLLKTKN